MLISARGRVTAPLESAAASSSATARATNAAEKNFSSRDIGDAVGDTPEAVGRYYPLAFERVEEAALAQVGGAIRNARAGDA